MTFYVDEEEAFGHLFAGKVPAVSIEDLVSMALDSYKKNRIRIPAKAMRFDPKD